ncbi:MAG: PKD domain-containing protein, partial [Rhodothermales bacterium]|nr:PKD domain-containing protein [Rhodothermales bacterium]
MSRILSAIIWVSFLVHVPAAAQDLTNALVGYWPMDGSVADASGNGRDAQIVGSPSFVADRSGNAASAIGGFTTSSYVVIPHGNDVMPNTGFSAGGFFRFDAVSSGSQTLFSKSEGIDYALRLYNGTLDNLSLSYNASSFGAGSWHHVMMTWDGSTYRLWINGTVVASAAQAGPIGGFTMPLALGIEIPEYSGGPYNPLQGAIDEFRFYGRALTTTEVQVLAGLNVNQAPTAAISADPTTGPAPLTVTFDGTDSSDPNGDTLTYLWDLGDATSSADASVSHTYLTAGTYAVSLTVSDPDGESDTAALSYTVQANVAPTASFTFSYQNYQRPISVFFDASASTDTAGDVLTYTWDFGDGQTGSGETLVHTFTDVAGDIPVTLTVTDLGGLTAQSVQDVGVPNRTPSASFDTSPSEGMAPLTVTFTHTGTDPDGDSITRAWEFGDGTTGTAGTETHTYNVEGTYAVTLTVEDEFGASSTGTATITVARFNTAPTVVVTASPLSGQAPLEVSFDASGTTDAEGDAITYAWDFGDGQTGSGVTTSHTYNVSGTITATVTATDALGMSDTGTVSIELLLPENTVVSTTSGGDWNGVNTWIGGVPPAPDQLVLITSAVTGSGACAGMTVESTGTWTPGGAATVEGDLTNRGTIVSLATIGTTGDLTNLGQWTAPAFIAGDLVNQGNLEGPVAVTGDFHNSGRYATGMTADVEGTVTNTGQWEAALAVAGPVHNEGSWTASLLTLDGSDGQRFSHADGFPFSADIVLTATSTTKTGRSIVGTGRLEILAALNLGGQVLDVTADGLLFGPNARPVSGTIRHADNLAFPPDFPLGEEVTYQGDLTINSKLQLLRGTRLEGAIVNEDSLVVRGEDAAIQGSILNRGVVSMAGATAWTIEGDVENHGTWSVYLTEIHGDVLARGRWAYLNDRTGSWQLATINLLGNRPRNLDVRQDVWVNATPGTRIQLADSNWVPTLTGCTYDNTTCSVLPGGVLTGVFPDSVFGDRDRWSRTLDQRIANSGEIIDTRTFATTHRGGYGTVYRGSIELSKTESVDSLRVHHWGQVPASNASAVRAWWRVKAFPAGVTDTRIKRLVLP